MLAKHERLAEFLRRLAMAHAASTGDEALALLASILVAVEDELTSIPNNPDTWQSDGRMYPPQDDQRRDLDDHPQVVRYRSLAHHTFFAAHGAIEIRAGHDWRRATVIFEKPGANGKKVWEP